MGTCLNARPADTEGRKTSFESVELGEVLKLAGVKFCEALRGKMLELFLVVDTPDGYRALFVFPELDHAFTDRVILFADPPGWQSSVGCGGAVAHHSAQQEAAAAKCDSECSTKGIAF